jgi:hypothetical protein
MFEQIVVISSKICLPLCDTPKVGQPRENEAGACHIYFALGLVQIHSFKCQIRSGHVQLNSTVVFAGWLKQLVRGGVQQTADFSAFPILHFRIRAADDCANLVLVSVNVLWNSLSLP